MLISETVKLVKVSVTAPHKALEILKTLRRRIFHLPHMNDTTADVDGGLPVDVIDLRDGASDARFNGRRGFEHTVGIDR